MEGRNREGAGSLPHKKNATVSNYGLKSSTNACSMKVSRVTSTVFTGDARFVLSGSDDGNVRIWKARAAEKLGVINSRERAAIEYRDSLRERWKVDPQVAKVARYGFSYKSCIRKRKSELNHRSRHIPKPVYKASQLKHTMLEARRVKEERRRKHTRAGETKPKAEKKKVVISERS